MTIRVAADVCKNSVSDWKGDFSQRWSATGIPFLMDVSPGYDAQLVFPGSVLYGHTAARRTALAEMVDDFGADGLAYNSWNGYTEAMTGMPLMAADGGDTSFEWLKGMTEAAVAEVPTLRARGAAGLFLGLLGFAVSRLVRAGSGTPSCSSSDRR